MTIPRFLWDSKAKPAQDLTLLSLIFGIAYFQCLNRFPLMGTDEARYMEIPREMLERGDFITPTLNYVAYFEKPPLHYWLNALATVLFGETAFAARFMGAMWGVLGVLMVYHLGRKLFGRRQGILSAVVLGTSLGVVIQGRTNITDTTLTFFLCASLGCFLLASKEDEPRKSLYYHLFYLFAALAVLAKGLIGLVLPGAIIIVFMALTKRWQLLKEMRLSTGPLLFLVVCAPWFVLVSLKNPDFPRFFFIHEHFERYLTKSHRRYQPPWFYIPILFGSMLPWSFFIPGALARFWQDRKGTGAEARLFLMIWSVLIIAFFSLSSSKLIPYILPVYPALALLIGCYFTDIFDRNWHGVRNQIALLAMSHFILGVGLMSYPLLARAPRITTQGGIIMGMIMLGQGALSLVNCSTARRGQLFCGLAMVSFLLGILGPPVIYESIVKRKVVKGLALKVKESAGQDAVIASFGYKQELPLYTQRRVTVVGSKGELEFGSSQGDHSSWFIEQDQFMKLWKSSRQVFALLDADHLGSLQKTLQPAPSLLGIEANQVLITNRVQQGRAPIVVTSLSAPQPDSTWPNR